MKDHLKSAYIGLVNFGIDPRKMIRSLRGLPSYFSDFYSLKMQMNLVKKEFPFGLPYPCLEDRFTESGAAKGHYFHQDLLVARRVNINNPEIHVDVGSRVDGFVAHVASCRSIVVIDIRPLSASIPNISFIQANMMTPVSKDLINYCDSLSCLHALEHFGLGRYGDPVDYYGYILGLNNFHRILKKNGKLYLSVPIGPQRIEFNAHRVFSVDYLLECFDGKFKINQFSYVDDNGDLHENEQITHNSAKQSFGCIYGCGIFEMTKL